MRDPYQVLGIPATATDDEVKKAYRELAKKYHPDNYANTEFSDIANEKMKEINEAYDEILRRRAGGQANSSSSGAGAGGQYTRIRELLSLGRVGEAEVMLDASSDRNAEWHYLKGLCAMHRRNYNAAASFFERACSMDPTNGEYAAMYRRFRGAQHNYGTFHSPNGQECSVCDICTHLICADCLCECCGGDLISCC